MVDIYMSNDINQVMALVPGAYPQKDQQILTPYTSHNHTNGNGTTNTQIEHILPTHENDINLNIRDRSMSFSETESNSSSSDSSSSSSHQDIDTSTSTTFKKKNRKSHGSTSISSSLPNDQNHESPIISTLNINQNNSNSSPTTISTTENQRPSKPTPLNINYDEIHPLFASPLKSNTSTSPVNIYSPATFSILSPTDKFEKKKQKQKKNKDSPHERSSEDSQERPVGTPWNENAPENVYRFNQVQKEPNSDSEKQYQRVNKYGSAGSSDESNSSGEKVTKKDKRVGSVIAKTVGNIKEKLGNLY
ncbi:hypothetical protein G9A89_010597 [Geosiphon pyriformis]|nr:hypothetical protein G9A89_010597 [Geosiphon pyriformis]